jgi:hypothetical protein
MGINMKVKRKKRRIPERFTRLQLLLSSCVKDLIQLNDLAKEGTGVSTSVIGHVEKLLRAITGEKYFLYDFKNNRYFHGHYIISFDGVQLLTFTGIMDLLQESVQLATSGHFVLTTVNDETMTSIITIESGNTPVADKLTGIHFNRVAAAAVLNDSIVRKRIGNVRITSRNYRLFQVEPISTFGESLLTAPPCEDPPETIPSIAFQSWTSFIQIFRSILINYYTSFGSYDRIKSCVQCGKLFFEKKKTTGMFCGRKCKKKHSDGPPDRYNCRMKQNRWLNYRYDYDRKIDAGDLSDRETIKKADCADCIVYPASGECIKLREKNPQLFLRLHPPDKNPK